MTRTKNTSFILVTLLAILSVLLITIPVYANSPILPDDSVSLYLKEYDDIMQIRFVLFDENGNELNMEENHNERPFIMDRPTFLGYGERDATTGELLLTRSCFLHDGHDYCFEFTFSDGTVYRTETINKENGKNSPDQTYLFNGKTRTFEPTMLVGQNGIGSFVSAIVYGIFLLLPLGCTMLTEWLVSLPFRIRRPAVIILTNLVSNVVMNVILSFALAYHHTDYIKLVLIAEVVVMGFEFLFYALKIRNYKKWLLLIYTIIANLTSWGLYALLGPGLIRTVQSLL